MLSRRQAQLAPAVPSRTLAASADPPRPAEATSQLALGQSRPGPYGAVRSAPALLSLTCPLSLLLSYRTAVTLLELGTLLVLHLTKLAGRGDRAPLASGKQGLERGVPLHSQAHGGRFGSDATPAGALLCRAWASGPFCLHSTPIRNSLLRPLRTTR